MIKKILTGLILIQSLGQFVLAGESDPYSFSWLDKDKEIYVLQNKKFRKAQNFHINLGYGKTTTGALVDATAIQGRAGYFFTEDWGIEGIYSINSGKESDDATAIRNYGGAGSIPFRRIVEKYYGAMVLWSPFYGKINTFNSIVYVDWMLGAGAGKLSERNNKQEFLTAIYSRSAQDFKETHTSIMWETALKFYITKNYHIRLDLVGSHYQAEIEKNSSGTIKEQKWYNNYDTTLSFGLNF